MTYVNKLQKYLDIFALSLSFKRNDNWLSRVEEHSSNYSTLFSIYSQMLEQDQEEFFARSSDKKAIIRSLDRSKLSYSITNNLQLLHILEQMTPNDPADFLILPLRCAVEPPATEGHVFGSYIYKEKDGYKIFLVNKQFKDASIYFVTIPNNNMPSVCDQLVLNKYNPHPEQPYYIYHKIIEHANGKQITPLSYRMHPQKTGNCIVKEIEATVKTALFHCRHDLFASQSLGKIKWNTQPDSVIMMRMYFLDAIKQEFNGPQKPFDLLFKLYLQRKERNKILCFSPFETKKKIHQEIKSEMNKYPEIQQILSGKNIYEEGIVIKRIDFFSKLSAENQCNLPHNNAKEKVMLFEKIAKAKEKTEIIFQENSKNKNAKSQVPLSIDQ
ncbi:hypothetical protein ACTNBL_00880 [Enterococcus villorum]|uniref:hypothetical protein n=1 Tax=Enterococcus villorum TaxID=112904 RepID=UPI003F8A41AA